MCYLIEGDFISIVCYHCWCSLHLHLYTFFNTCTDILLPFLHILPPPSHSYPISILHLQIQLPTSGLDNSSSDSSDFSSEDDSTVVLMKTRSRSPSPRKSKHRSHRSGSGSHSRSSSPAQTKMKALNVTDGSPSSTGTTAESESTGRPAEGSSNQVSAPGEKEKDTGDSGLWCTTESCCYHRSHSQLSCLLLNTSIHCMFSVMKIYSFWCHPFQEQPSGLSRRLTLPWVVLLSCAHCIFFICKPFTLSCVSYAFVRSQVWTVQGADTLH